MIKQCVKFSLISFGTAKYDCVIKTREMFSFLPLINNSVTIGLSVLSIISQKQLIFYVSYLDCAIQCFYKYHPNYSSIQ